VRRVLNARYVKVGERNVKPDRVEYRENTLFIRDFGLGELAVWSYLLGRAPAEMTDLTTAILLLPTFDC